MHSLLLNQFDSVAVQKPHNSIKSWINWFAIWLIRVFLQMTRQVIPAGKAKKLLYLLP
jgi:hypothetical protein